MHSQMFGFEKELKGTGSREKYDFLIMSDVAPEQLSTNWFCRSLGPNLEYIMSSARNKELCVGVTDMGFYN